MKTDAFLLDLCDEQMPRLSLAPEEVNLLLIFGERVCLEDPYLPGRLRMWFPKAEIAGREVAGEGGRKGSVQALALSFGKAQVETIFRSLGDGEDPRRAGWETGRRIDADDLKVVLLFGAGGEEICREVAAGMLEAFGPCPPLVCPGLPAEGAGLGGEVVLSSRGLFRRGFLVVGMFGSRLEVEENGAMPAQSELGVLKVQPWGTESSGTRVGTWLALVEDAA